MTIGNSFDLPEYNKEEDKLVKLGDKVQEWWNNLDDNTKYELLSPYYHGVHLGLTDEMWDGLSWNDKVDIYIDFNEKDEYMSSDELYDGDCMSNYNDDKENKKEEW